MVIKELSNGVEYQIYRNGKLDVQRTKELHELFRVHNVELFKEYGPEIFKILTNIDDIEILLAKDSTKIQRSSSGIFLLLAVLPIDRVKDILKSAKLLRNGDYSLDAIKLTAKEWETLKEFEKSADVVKTVDRGKDTGNIIRNVETLDDLKRLKNTDIFTDKSLKHVFEGELTKRGASGYHVDTIDGSIGKIVDGSKTAPNKYGVYEAQVEINGTLKKGNGGKSTFFPDNWSSQQIVDSINEAYSKKVFRSGNIYVGKLSNGMQIEMYINKTTGKLISAFPKY